MTKPRIIKNCGRWHVTINGRAWNTRKTWEDAMMHANRIATYAHTIREHNDIERIKAALDRMENNART